MAVPFSQIGTVTAYVLKQKLLRRKRFPLVLMLEPLFRCNLACSGCGKIQHPAEVLRRHLSPEECFRAVDQCPAPIVSIPGGEPLLHPEIDRIVAGLVARRKYVYLCTNALKLAESLDRFQPAKYLTFSIHIDGLRDEHDRSVCRDGVFDRAVDAVRQALARGFRVTTNTTLFAGARPEGVRQLFDELMALGVEGMMVSPGYSYAKAPDQEHFLSRAETIRLFRAVLDRPPRSWRFNQSPLFLEFLRGNHALECAPWGSVTYNLFGWQKPCYLLDEGHAASFQELMDTTDWHRYGHASGNPQCADCMVHSGHEPAAVLETFSSLRGLWKTARAALRPSRTWTSVSSIDSGAAPNACRPVTEAAEDFPLPGRRSPVETVPPRFPYGTFAATLPVVHCRNRPAARTPARSDTELVCHDLQPLYELAAASLGEAGGPSGGLCPGGSADGHGERSE